MLALLVLSSRVGSAGSAGLQGGPPHEYARGRSAAGHGFDHDADESDSGLVIEGEGEEEEEDRIPARGGPGAAASCVDLEFPEEMIADALQLAAEGRGAEGLVCLRYGASLDPPPEFAEYYDALASLEEQHGDADAARQALEHALDLEPEYAVAVLRLGNWYAARGDEEEAIVYFQRTSEIRPDSAVPYNNMGLAHMRRKDKAAALEAFEEGLRVSQEPQGIAMLYNNLGIIYRDTGDQEQALETFRHAQSAAPSVEAAINIASTLSDIGRFEEAEAEIRAGLTLQAHPTALRVLSAALAFQDRLLEAAQGMYLYVAISVYMFIHTYMRTYVHTYICPAVITEAGLDLHERRRLTSDRYGPRTGRMTE